MEVVADRLEHPWSVAFLFDILLSEDFATSRVLYLSFAQGTDEANHVRIVRARLDSDQLTDVTPIATAGVRPEIYSYGHRNVQAIVFNRATGMTYAHEHGPRGGDELNLIQPGNNYGWPLITHGRDYGRSLISPFTALPGMELRVVPAR